MDFVFHAVVVVVLVHNAHFRLDYEGAGGVAVASVAVLAPLVAMVYQLATFHALLGTGFIRDLFVAFSFAYCRRAEFVS